MLTIHKAIIHETPIVDKKRPWKRAAIVTGSFLLVLLIGSAVFLAVEWPTATFIRSTNALAQLKVFGFPQSVVKTTVSVGGENIPITFKNEMIFPSNKLNVATPATVSVTLERSPWISWLVGRTETIQRRIVTPTARILNEVAIGSPGDPVVAYFSRGVRTVSVSGANGTKIVNLSTSLTKVSLLNDIGTSKAGTLHIAAVSDSWETLPIPTKLVYFRETSKSPIAVISPNTTNLSPSSTITVTLSQPISTAFGSKLPNIVPAINGANSLNGQWKHETPYTLMYTPSQPDFWPSEAFTLKFPVSVSVALPNGGLSPVGSTLNLQGVQPSITRLQQLLAHLNYLPLTWTPAPGDPATATVADLAQSALIAPNGTFSWRWSMPSNLTSLWTQGSYNVITQGAVMAFEQFNHLDTNGLANPLLWPTLIQDTIANTIDPHRYSWINVQKQRPESLNLYENGTVVFTGLDNTGIPGLTTTVGTFPIYLRFVQDYMSGTNPNGSTYHDLVHWINYFIGSEAVHGFARSQYGFPQSLGCVELSVSDAAIIYPQVHIGTLVTVVAQ